MSKKSNTSEGSKRDNVKWTEHMDNVFIEAMLDQQAKGFRVDGTFTSTAYKNILSTCVENFGISLTKAHLKNRMKTRMKTLKSHFNTYNDLFKHKSGIAWSFITKIFEAEPSVWDELIAANSLVKKWRSTPIQNYNKLEELFSKDRAIGASANTCREYMNVCSLEGEEQANRPLDEDAFDVSATQFHFSEDIDTTSPAPGPQCKSTSEYTSSSKAGKRKMDMDSSVLQETNNKLERIIVWRKATTFWKDKPFLKL